MKKIVLLAVSLISVVSFAQEKSISELKAEKSKKEKELAKLKGEVSGLNKKIAEFPGWKFGGMGTIGANFSGAKNWYSNANSNSAMGSIGVVINGYANLDTKDYFWRNTGVVNLGWTNLDTNTLDDIKTDYEITTDALNINSLFGYKISETFAASSLMEYRTSVIKNFNNPGYLDIGVGTTWKPISELVVVLHPLNYNFVFSDGNSSYNSSLGCKVMAEYNKDFGFMKYRSNLSGFMSYENIKDYSNWTWVNSAGFNVWKGIGVGLEYGLRSNKQEAFNTIGSTDGLLENSENPLQSYWLVGLSYKL